jgi:alpha-beta hydrolase superfamily lysophospholipase
LDRYVFRWLPWSTPVVWAKEVLVRGTYIVAGSVGASVVRLGLVPPSEAFSVGAALSVGGFLFESLFDFLLPSTPPPLGRSERAGRNPWVRAGCAGLLFLAFLVFAAPLEALHPLRTVPKRSPAAVGLAFEEVRFATADGVELAGWLVPHPQAQGNVIFCHGHGRNREHGTGFLPTLHELRLNVLAFDFRGHGDSAGHTATFGRCEVQDLVAAEAFLSHRFPGKRVFLVGISYGAAVALQALPQLPAVRAVWCEGCFSRFMPVVENQFTRLPPALRKPLVSAYQVLAWLDCGFWGPDINPIDRLERVRIPIYFCHGLADELVPFSEGKQLYDGYNGPKACYWVEDAHHYDLRRRNKQEYLYRLRKFLAESLPAGAEGATP